jgi:hypothetical protein
MRLGESTNQTNKRVAEQTESAHRMVLAKSEVGIRDRQAGRTYAGRFHQRSGSLPTIGVVYRKLCGQRREHGQSLSWRDPK